MAYVDLRQLHNPTPGRPVASAWGAGVVSNFEVFSERDAVAEVASQSTSSTSFTNLSGSPGPEVTAQTGTKALCVFGMQTTPGVDFIVSIAVNGLTTIAADPDKALVYGQANGFWTGFGYFDGLNPGNNVFTVRYSVTSGSCTFQRRRLLVIPLA